MVTSFAGVLVVVMEGTASRTAQAISPDEDGPSIMSLLLLASVHPLSCDGRDISGGVLTNVHCIISGPSSESIINAGGDSGHGEECSSALCHTNAMQTVSNSSSHSRRMKREWRLNVLLHAKSIVAK